ncbi:hypothetical protein ACK1O1_11110 [Stenotrophomonas maltophilia]|uniref:hypothetical protein n=1 Tax=Stenotrophomonas maltophilia TaxID=40324 RepID=UPI003916FC51
MPLFALLLLMGCSHTRDYSLSPTTDAGMVSVTVKVPNELVAADMKVVYRSTTCTSTFYSMLDGERYTRDNYNRLVLQPVRIADTDIYEAMLAIDGGGACHWRLSNVHFGVQYATPSAFGEGITQGWGGEVTVIFDEMVSPYGWTDFKVDGDLSIRRDYYPWLNERFLGGYSKTIGLTSSSYGSVIYRAENARRVHFEPVLHPQFLTRSAGPKVKAQGNRTTFYYPDGSNAFELYHQPNFLKLEAIRIAAEAQHQGG